MLSSAGLRCKFALERVQLRSTRARTRSRTRPALVLHVAHGSMLCSRCACGSLGALRVALRTADAVHRSVCRRSPFCTLSPRPAAGALTAGVLLTPLCCGRSHGLPACSLCSLITSRYEMDTTNRSVCASLCLLLLCMLSLCLLSLCMRLALADRSGCVSLCLRWL